MSAFQALCRCEHARPATRLTQRLPGTRCASVAGVVEALPDEGGDAPRKRAPALCPPLGTISARHSATPPPEPPDIIEGLLPRDAGGFVGPGGYGKTTVMLALAVAVILGREFCGHQVRQGGRALYITAEDSRETLEGRLWRVCEAQNLTEAERAAVFERFHILDYTTNAVRLASAEAGATVAARQIGEAYAGAGPSGEATSGDHGPDRQLPAAGAGRRAAAHPGRGGSERPRAADAAAWSSGCSGAPQRLPRAS